MSHRVAELRERAQRIASRPTALVGPLPASLAGGRISIFAVRDAAKDEADRNYWRFSRSSSPRVGPGDVRPHVVMAWADEAIARLLAEQVAKDIAAAESSS